MCDCSDQIIIEEIWRRDFVDSKILEIFQFGIGIVPDHIGLEEMGGMVHQRGIFVKIKRPHIDQTDYKKNGAKLYLPSLTEVFRLFQTLRRAFLLFICPAAG
jgi:hypothetical protein